MNFPCLIYILPVFLSMVSLEMARGWKTVEVSVIGWVIT